MTEKLNTEQIGREIKESKEESFGIRPEVELSQVGTSAEIPQSSIIKIDPRNLNNSITEDNKKNDKQQEHVSTDIETSGNKWSEVIRNKQEAGVETELPL